MSFLSTIKNDLLIFWKIGTNSYQIWENKHQVLTKGLGKNFFYLWVFYRQSKTTFWLFEKSVPSLSKSEKSESSLYQRTRILNLWQRTRKNFFYLWVFYRQLKTTCWFLKKSVPTLSKSKKTRIKSLPKFQDPETLSKE